MADRQNETEFRRRIRLNLGLLSVLILLAAAFIVVVAYRRSHPRTSYDFFVAGVKGVEQRDYERALRMFGESLRLEGTNTDYLQAAARAAAVQGKKREALGFAQKAWDLGRQSPELARLIVGNLDGQDMARDFDRSLKLARQLPPSNESEELLGDVFFLYGKNDEAIKTWKTICDQHPKGELIVKIATSHLAAQQPERAAVFLEEQLAKGTLTEAGYSMLAGIYAADDARYPQALAVFAAAIKHNQYSVRLKLEHGLAFLLSQNIEQAESTLASLRTPANDPSENAHRASARLYLGAILLGQGDKSRLEELRSLCRQAPAGASREGEECFYQALLLILDRKNGSLEYLRKARKLIPQHPAIALVFAAESTKMGAGAEAIESCNSVRGVMSKWPPLLLELVTALSREGRNAEALRALNQLHRRNLYSKRSLALLRDVAYGARLTELGHAAQGLLELQCAGDADIQSYSGYSALRQGALDQADRIFRELSDKYPAEARFKLGQIQVLLARGENETALKALQELGTKTELIAPLQAIAYARLQRWEDAAAAFRTALSIAQPAIVNVEYGRLLLHLGQLAEAARQFEAALLKAPAQSEAHLGLALLYYQTNKLSAAREHATQASAGRPALDAPQMLLLASAELRHGDSSNALAWCHQALAMNPRLVEALKLQARAQLRLGRLAEAEKGWQAILSQRPDDEDSKSNLAIIAMRLGNFSKALELVNQVLARNPGNQGIQLLRFEILALSGQLELAETVLAGMKAELDPTRHALCAARLNLLNGDTNSAMALLEKHLDNREVAVCWANLQLRLKNPESAFKAISKHSLTPDQWASLGDWAARQRLAAAAAHCYREALRRDPANPVLLNNWAWNAIQLPGFEQATVLEACRKALEGAPHSPDILDTYAEALLRSQRFSDCISLLTAHRTVVDQQPQLLWLKAQAYEAIQQRENALSTYRLCRQLFPLKNGQEIRFTPNELDTRLAQLQAKHP